MKKFPFSPHDLTKNSPPPPTHSTTTLSSSSSSSSSSVSSNMNLPRPPPPPPYYNPVYHQPGLVQFPAAVPGQYSAFQAVPFLVGPNGEVLGLYPNNPAVLSEEQQTKRCKVCITKLNRSRRRLARQRSLNSTRSNTTTAASLSSSSSSSSAAANSRSGHGVNFPQRNVSREMAPPVSAGSSRLQNNGNNQKPAVNRDLYTVCSSDKKKLKALVTKELKNSDVGALGRIVLPKKQAEEKLPSLTAEINSMQVLIRDVYSNQEWRVKFKYWLNNKSRMYILENTGDFVKANGLRCGDSITLSEDEQKNLYVSIKRRETAEPSEAAEEEHELDLTNPNMSKDDNNSPTSDKTEYSSNKTEETYDGLYAKIANQLSRDEDESSLASIIEQLVQMDQQQQEANSNSVTTALSHVVGSGSGSGSGSSSHDHVEGSSASTTQPLPDAQLLEDDLFDDCFRGLGSLPEVDRCSCYSCPSLFDSIWSDDDIPSI